jgi:predicted ATP-dependent serine protease
MGISFSLKQLREHQFDVYKFSEEWAAILSNKVEHGFNAIVFGESGSGKTTFVLNFCKELTNFGNVYYNTLEQGKSGSLQEQARQVGLLNGEFDEKIKFGTDTFDEMFEKIKTTRARFIIVDSINYMGKNGLTYNQYQQLKEFCKRSKSKNKKSLILISHASAKQPKGNYAKKIRYDVDIKIQCIKGKAYSDSRYGATKPYTIFSKKDDSSLF